MRKLYLDVDGVLLTTKNTQIAEGIEDFINYIVTNFDCYWLTTHCKDGSTKNVLNMLSQYVPNHIAKQLLAVKPTIWNSLKTEAIDFKSDFYWIDDCVFNAERQILYNNNCINKLILVDLNNPEELIHVIEKLKEQD